MTTDGTATLSADVATEIRAWMGRLGISQAELARRLGQNGQWVSVRISPRASVSITLDETQRIADALGILVRDLLPAYTLERKASTKSDAATVGYRQNAERPAAVAERMTRSGVAGRTDRVRTGRPTAGSRRRPKAATTATTTRRPALLDRPIAA